MTQKFDPEKVLLIERYNPESIITAVYADMKQLQFNVKRFKIETTTLRNKFLFIKEGDGNYLECVTTAAEPVLQVQSGRGDQVRQAKFKLAKVTDVMGWKAVGAKLTDYNKSVSMQWIETKESESPQQELFAD
jgi:topoisomerase-4 subunit A